MNLDIGGTATAALRMGDSNPGFVRLSPGGVGRNIAHNLSKLGVRTELLTAFGGDALAETAKRFCTDAGIGIDRARSAPEGQTSVYLYLCSPDGEMQMAVNDMSLCEAITPDYLQGCLPVINASSLLIADANLPAESLRFLAENASVPVFADPVSAAKAEKLRPVLGRLHTLKPNRMEAELLSGVEIRDGDSLRKAAEALLDTGLRRVFISLGAEGVFAASHTESCLVPAFPAQVRNVTGAGDACMAALGWAFLRGLSLGRAALAGNAAACFALESTETVSAALSEAALLAKMNAEEAT